ncbi:MAG: hypothetical protein J0H71_01190 [Rhizobiales bacterium]|nr:hypothetical protein [Hyphomicrobiales bacterium]
MNFKYLATAAAIATLAATAAQAQTQTSPQPTQKMQQGSSTTMPHGKAGATGTVGSANHAGSRSGKGVKPAPEGTMEQRGGSSLDSDTAPGSAPGTMSR